MRRVTGASKQEDSFLCLWVEAGAQASCLLGRFLVKEMGKGLLVDPAGEGRWKVAVPLESKSPSSRLISRVRDQARRLEPHLGRINVGWELRPKGEKKLKVEKRFFREFVVSPSLKIAPPGGGPLAQKTAMVLEIDPGRDFNCGLEPWTQAALLALEEVMHREEVGCALDLKAGCGIMALGAATFGVEKVVALDSNPQAVKLTRANARRNNLKDRIRAKCAGLREQGGTYQLVVGLASHKFLLKETRTIASKVAQEGILLIGGFWYRWTESVLEGLKEEFELLERKRAVWWETLVLRKRK